MKHSIQPHKSSIGDLQANIMALISYFIGSVLVFIPGIMYLAWLAPLVIFFLEKESRFVKFHAMQAFLLDAVGVLLGLLLTLLIGGISYETFALITTLAALVSVTILGLAVYSMYQAYKYVEFSIPIIGKLSLTLTGKVR
jgi:uncharacterized membrane protein